ncbi:MAG: hypothetical protein FJW20_03360 [Acidimicrobiia bacterium]|nr:hypothetical protein [Acidimicrobiia bacterium]
MDVERTMDFILQTQAKTEAILQEMAAEQKGLAAEQKGLAAEQKKLAAQQAKTERQVNALAKLVQTGMKMLVQMEKRSTAREKRTDERIQALVDSQLRMDQRMDRFLAAFEKRWPNGGSRPARP